MNEQQFEYDVFLTYASADKATVLELAERLKRDGLRVWSKRMTASGGPGSARLIPLTNSVSQPSTLDTQPSYTALFRGPTNQQRRFIPLRHDDCEIKDSFKQFSYNGEVN